MRRPQIGSALPALLALVVLLITAACGGGETNVDSDTRQLPSPVPEQTAVPATDDDPDTPTPVPEVEAPTTVPTPSPVPTLLPPSPTPVPPQPTVPVVSDAVPSVQELLDIGLTQTQAECFIATIDPDETGRVQSAELFVEALSTCT